MGSVCRSTQAPPQSVSSPQSHPEDDVSLAFEDPQIDGLEGEQWERFSALVAGDLELLSEVADAFLSESKRLLAELGAAVASNDYNQTSRLAHSLKGALQSVGSESTAEMAHELEQMGRNSNLQHAHDVYQELRSRTERMVNALREQIGGVGG